MRHAYRSGAVSDEPPASGASSAGFPQDDTTPGARWAHSISSEIVNTIEDAGLTPDGSDLTQLRQAIAAKIEEAVDGLVIPPGVSLATVASTCQQPVRLMLGATPAGLRAMLAAVAGGFGDRTDPRALQNNPPERRAATPAGLRAMLDALFGGANRREFTTPGCTPTIGSGTWHSERPAIGKLLAEAAGGSGGAFGGHRGGPSGRPGGGGRRRQPLGRFAGL